MSPSSKKRSKVTIRLQEADVLCGKTSTSKHPGNLYFRELVLSSIDAYMAATRKAHKGQITTEILDRLARNGARFIKLDPATGMWSVLPAADAREKVSHAIRDRVNERKKGKVVLPQFQILESPPRVFSTSNENRIAGTNKSKVFSASNPTYAKYSNRRKTTASSKNLEIPQSNQVPPSTQTMGINEGTNGQEISIRREGISLHQSLSQSLRLLHSTEHPLQQNHHLAQVLDDLSCFSSNLQLSSNANLRSDTYPSRTPIMVDLDDDCFSTVFDENEMCDDRSYGRDRAQSCDLSSSSGDMFLDDYNELFIDDMPSQEEDSDFILSMLQEACTSMYP